MSFLNDDTQKLLNGFTRQLMEDKRKKDTKEILSKLAEDNRCNKTEIINVLLENEEETDAVHYIVNNVLNSNKLEWSEESIEHMSDEIYTDMIDVLSLDDRSISLLKSMLP